MEGFYTATDGTAIFYRIDDFTDQWKPAKTVLFIHGFGESTEAWRAWVPYFARHYRVLRYDIRGFGRSTPMAANHPWSIGEVMADINGLLDHLKIKDAHVMGGKSGGTIALKYAADFPARVTKLGLLGAPVKGPHTKPWLEIIESRGVQAWASETMPGRFGTMLAPDAIAWWTELMARTPKTTLQSYLRWVPGVDITEDVKRIACPTLLIVGNAGPLHKVEEIESWQRTIKNSELRVIDGDGWHAGGARPDECAGMVAEFLRRGEA